MALTNISDGCARAGLEGEKHHHALHHTILLTGNTLNPREGIM